MREVELSIGKQAAVKIPEVVFEGFCATVSYRLEPNGWGSRFPALLNELHSGRLAAKRTESALAEIDTVDLELRALPPEKVVWNYHDLRRRDDGNLPVNHSAESARDYFITAEGVPVTSALRSALEASGRSGAGIAAGTDTLRRMRLWGWAGLLGGLAFSLNTYWFFPHWIMQPMGDTSHHGVLLWPFGLVLAVAGIGGIAGWIHPNKGLAGQRHGVAASIVLAAVLGAVVYFGYR